MLYVVNVIVVLLGLVVMAGGAIWCYQQPEERDSD